MIVEMTSLWKENDKLQREIEWKKYYSNCQREIIEKKYKQTEGERCMEYLETQDKLRADFTASQKLCSKIARIFKSGRIMVCIYFEFDLKFVHKEFKDPCSK